MDMNFLRNNLRTAFIIGLFCACGSSKVDNGLKYYGIGEITAEGDTMRFVVPSFTFLDQDSNWITHETMKGKIYVTDFFFTTCPTICPCLLYTSDAADD